MITEIMVFLGAIILSRIINERAMKELSPEEKTRLLDSFSGMRAYSLIPLVLILGGFFLATGFTDWDEKIILYVYLALLLVFIVGNQIYVYKKLLKENFKKKYIQMYSLSRVVIYIGMGIFMYGVAEDMAGYFK
ncbi:MAG: hypothetical protein OEZ36_13500 [Spirochaetota bacterium]|nr:hypothetical protein [Spirochaetota bacterium]